MAKKPFDTTMTLGQRIKQLRVQQGLNQFHISDKLSMNRANFSHYERDTAMPPGDTLGEIADILGTTTDYLLGRDIAEQPEPTPPQSLESRITYLEQELAELRARTTPVDISELSEKVIREIVKRLRLSEQSA